VVAETSRKLASLARDCLTDPDAEGYVGRVELRDHQTPKPGIWLNFSVTLAFGDF
jgi:hypothetical protein